MKVADLIAAMETIAPTSLAQDWDNVGLLVGAPDRELSGPVLLTIDLTEAVLEEASGAGAAAVIAYHPPIFHALKRVVLGPGSSATQRVVHGAICAGIAVYSPHTALDAAAGGITDWLADGLLGGAHSGGPSASGGGDRRAISPLAPDAHPRVKIVTFVPEKDLERVRGALASAGAGRIGEYELCSFGAPGEGTFLGSRTSKPTIGAAGAFETVREIRLEMICPTRALALALATLRQLHPYEEPAVDVYPLEPQPRRDIGVGRRITLDQPATLSQLAGRLKKHLGVPAVHVAPAPGVDPASTRLDRLGAVPGAGASVADAARAEGCQVFVTGEMKHHEVLALAASGVSVILGGHTATERGYLPHLARRLSDKLKGATIRAAQRDMDPLSLA